MAHFRVNVTNTLALVCKSFEKAVNDGFVLDAAAHLFLVKGAQYTFLNPFSQRMQRQMKQLVLSMRRWKAPPLPNRPRRLATPVGDTSGMVSVEYLRHHVVINRITDRAHLLTNWSRFHWHMAGQSGRNGWWVTRRRSKSVPKIVYAAPPSSWWLKRTRSKSLPPPVDRYPDLGPDRSDRSRVFGRARPAALET
jgi:hypothetical protein